MWHFVWQDRSAALHPGPAADRWFRGRLHWIWHSYSAEPPRPDDRVGSCTKEHEYLRNQIVQTEAERRRRETVVIQWTQKGLRSCLYEVCKVVCQVVRFVCAFEDFSRLRVLTEPKVVPYGRVVDTTLLKDFFLARWCSCESVAHDRISHQLNIMVRATAATVARDLGSDSSLPKLRN